MFVGRYDSPLGGIKIVSDGCFITEVAFDETCQQGQDCPAIDAAKKWLDEYFDCKVPTQKVQLKTEGMPFQKSVWQLLEKLDYGQSITYGQLAEALAKQSGIKKMSARAVGRAVGANKIAIMIPCHRVLGAGGRLTGYAGGLDKKIGLLNIEMIKYKN